MSVQTLNTPFCPGLWNIWSVFSLKEIHTFLGGAQASLVAQWLKKKKSSCQCRRYGFNPWVGKIPWRRKWQSTPVFLPEKSHWWGNLAGCSPWRCKESDMTERLKHNRTEGRWLGDRRPLWRFPGSDSPAGPHHPEPTWLGDHLLSLSGQCSWFDPSVICWL